MAGIFLPKTHSPMKTILALDSSSENCSIAVYHQYVMSLRSEHAPRKHTQLILPLMKQELADRTLSLDDVDAIAFGAGPGSFTGIRIAAGVAQGLAYGLSIPIYAISNLKALALQSYLANKCKRVLACVDARMDEVYWGMFEVTESQVIEQGFQVTRYSVTCLSGEKVGSPNSIRAQTVYIESHSNQKTAGIGTGIALLEEDILKQLSVQDNTAQPNADTIAFLAETAIAEGELGELNEALPSYVRDTVTWKKLPGRD